RARSRAPRSRRAEAPRATPPGGGFSGSPPPLSGALGFRPAPTPSYSRGGRARGGTKNGAGFRERAPRKPGAPRTCAARPPRGGRDFSGLDLLAVWIDGIQLGPYHVICAAGADDRGHKHVLGLREGATENAEVATALLEDLAGRGVDSKRRRLFVIDGALALRKAVALVFGVGTPVQRCRNHKLRNVLGHLPAAQHDQARSTLKAAFKLDAKEGTAQLQKYATWLERDWPGAAGSLREGLDEMFTINRLGLPSELRRSLGTTNLIDNGHSALRDRVRRVKH